MYALAKMSEEFKTLGVPSRPAFRLQNAIEDSVTFSSIWQAASLYAAIETLLADEHAYQAYHANRGGGIIVS